jgi:hypothetical protein
LVSPKAFVDRRNPEAIICAHFNQRTDEVPGFRIEGGWNDWECNIALPDLPDLPGDLPELCDFTVTGYKDIQQGFLTEVWVEKTTMNDVLDPLCRRYGANLITGAGELSITAVVDFLKRARQASRPARILYISDFDPAGLGMPISVARKIEFEQRTTSDGDIDIRLHPIALTAGQVKKYHLPRVPVKETDRRKVHFEAAYGPGAVELDALEALHPGELGRLVEGAILRHYDPTLEERALKVRGALQASLQRARAAVLARYQPDLDSLRDDYRTLLDDYEKMQSEFAELVQRFQPRLNFYKERLAHIQERGRALNTLIAKRLGDVEVDLNDYSLPAPDLPKEAKSLLYDSRREYLKQLAAYKARRDGAAG